jgi:hypothetical protein
MGGVAHGGTVESVAGCTNIEVPDVAVQDVDANDLDLEFDEPTHADPDMPYAMVEEEKDSYA